MAAKKKTKTKASPKRLRVAKPTPRGRPAKKATPVKKGLPSEAEMAAVLGDRPARKTRARKAE